LIVGVLDESRCKLAVCNIASVCSAIAGNKSWKMSDIVVVGGGNRPFGLLIELTDQKVCYHTHLLRSSELVLEMLVPSKDLKR
jgi:hypothetical protein